MDSDQRIGQLQQEARVLFAEAGVASPELDARLLMQEAIMRDHAGLISARDSLANKDEVRRFKHMVQRRLNGEPVQRILGSWEFFGRSFKLSEETLVPRPETELLVEGVIRRLELLSSIREPRILDIGTGSGVIAISVACELKSATVVATDVAVPALETARDNAIAQGVADRVEFVQSDIYCQVSGSFDAIVSNPPYIRRSEISKLHPEVRDHDPHIALDGGPDGLDFYREILEGCKSRLNPGGFIALEFGRGQAPEILELLKHADDYSIEIEKDLSGTDRTLFAKL